MKQNLILIGMVESPHLQKWVKATISTEVFKNIIIIPSDYPVNKLNYKSLGLLVKPKSKLKVFKIPIGNKFNNYLFRILDLIFGLNWRAFVIFICIRIYRPKIVHFHELQHGGYIYNSPIFKSRKRKYKVICSTWGSDLILYGKLKSHEKHLKQLLLNTNVLTAERNDDEEIARVLDFSGQFIAPLYITIGAQAENNYSNSKPSDRKMILIKGYQDNHGRALNALAAIASVANQLEGFKIRVFSASTAVQIQVEYLQNNCALDIEIIKRTSNYEMRNYFGLSRIYIGLAISDGLSTSMVEAIEQGTFPIQSENSAAKLFIKNGITGFIVDPWNISELARCIECAIKDNNMVDSAAIENLKILREKYSFEEGMNQIKELYKT